jgi:hypothetical protein
VGGRAEGAPVDLRQAERGVVRRDHDVGVAGQADAAAEAEPLHRGDHRHRAVVDRGEGGEAPPAGTEQGIVPRSLLHLLDVNAGAEAAALGGDDHGPYRGVVPCRRDGVRQVEPALHRQRVDRREVDDHLGDAAAGAQLDPHRRAPNGLYR